MILRALVLSAIHPAPKHILMIGLSSGSWGQVFANHPQVESFDVVEINPGYLQLIPEYPVVRSLLQNPKVHIFVDDGRRWLDRSPRCTLRCDYLQQLPISFWRDHSSGLLSVEFFKMARTTLIPAESITSTRPSRPKHLPRLSKFFPMACASSISSRSAIRPSRVAATRWLDTLREYRSTIATLFDPADAMAQQTLGYYVRFANSINLAPVQVGLEGSDSLRKKYGRERLITDDNMGREWELEVSHLLALMLPRRPKQG